MPQRSLFLSFDKDGARDEAGGPGPRPSRCLAARAVAHLPHQMRRQAGGRHPAKGGGGGGGEEGSVGWSTRGRPEGVGVPPRGYTAAAAVVAAAVVAAAVAAADSLF